MECTLRQRAALAKFIIRHAEKLPASWSDNFETQMKMFDDWCREYIDVREASLVIHYSLKSNDEKALQLLHEFGLPERSK